MLIVIGRALLFFNMTKGKSYFKQLCDHNISQARDRIAEWQKGPQLRGENEWVKFAIAWDDIDHIHVISVVDGRHAANIDHPIQGLGLSDKVRLCSTLTSNVLRELASRGGGARDLIAICKEMIGRGQISEKAGIRLVRKRHNELLYAAMASVNKQPSRTGPAIIGGREVSAFEEFRFRFEGVRRDPHQDLVAFSDFAWSDIFPTIAFIISNIAEMEYLDQGQLRVSVYDQLPRFMVAISTNQSALTANIQQLTKRVFESECAFLYVVSMTDLGPVESLLVNAPPKTFATEVDLGTAPSAVQIA
ncbi:hypothetical protein GFM13_19135 [Rhizobium leguminosarum bv. viciae]|nr:hypothetical protein [Rhizobium leguminosarum bv. viciae]